MDPKRPLGIRSLFGTWLASRIQRHYTAQATEATNDSEQWGNGIHSCRGTFKGSLSSLTDPCVGAFTRVKMFETRVDMFFKTRVDKSKTMRRHVWTDTYPTEDTIFC